MATALICATLATLVSFFLGWLLARLSIRAVLLCLPSAGPNRVRIRAENSAEGGA